MSTQTDQQYIVHLEVRATAADPTEAVHAALETVQRGALGNVAWTVEAATDPAAPALPVPHSGSDGNPPAATPKRSHHGETYRGEFLG